MRVLALLFLCAAALRAQDPFEMIVFEYDPLPFGAFIYETHLNYVVDGTKEYEGTVTPTQDQFHFSSEWPIGLTNPVRRCDHDGASSGRHAGIRRISAAAAFLRTALVGTARQFGIRRRIFFGTSWI
jgi:hypothetical protein